MFSTLEQPGIGAYLVPASPLELTAAGRMPPRRAPELGEHTEEILAGVLGLGAGEIGRLFDAGVVAGRLGAQACRPHSVLPVPAQRPSRPAPGTVQCVHPIVG